MQPGEIIFVFVAGATLIVFGLVPRFLENLEEGIRNFSAMLSYSFPRVLAHPQRVSKTSRVGLVAIGSALIVASFLLTLLK